MRLEPASLGLVHLRPDPLDVGERQRLGGQRRVLDRVAHPVADRGVDDLVEPGPHLGSIAVADRLDQQVAQSASAERLAEHVEDLAPVGASRCSSSLSSSRRYTWPSRVSSATRFHMWQTSVWPMRWTRPKRCSMRFGFHGRS